MGSKTRKDPDPAPNPRGLWSALGRCSRIALAAKKQVHDTGPRGMSKEGAFSVGDGVKAERDSTSKSLMRRKSRCRETPKANIPNVKGLAPMARKQPSHLHESWVH